MPTPMHLSQMFDEACARNAGRMLLMSSNGREFSYSTYGELHSDVVAWAEFLRSQGVKSGDRVAAVAQKSPNHFRFMYACWRLGAIAVPICESLGDDEMSFIIKDCEPKLLLAERSYMEKVQRNGAGINAVDWDTIPKGTAGNLEIKPEKSPFFNEAEAIDSIAVLIYTSGSTGMPKGVMLTQKNLWWNIWSVLKCFNVTHKDRIMSLLPYWHAYALTCEVGCTILGGFSCCIPHNKADFSRNISKYQPTLVLVVPRVMDTIYGAFKKKIAAQSEGKRKFINNAIYNASRIFTAGTKWNGGIFRMIYHHLIYDPFVFKNFRKALGGKIRMFVSGGAPLDLDVQSFFSYCGMPVLQGYGLTETAPVVSSNLIENYRLGSCGRVMPWLLPENGGDLIFKDEDGNLGRNIHGQLLVKGNCVMPGYWRHKDASAKTMENGWLNTGDVGHIDKDGYLFIHGRNNSMIVLYGGEKLHPEYIEDAVKSSPLISEAMVIGEKCKNVYVCVNVPKEEMEKHTPEELHALLKAEVERCTANLAVFQKPKDVLVLPEFKQEDGTMTATLKVRRFKIKELYREQIEAFLLASGEQVATKKDLVVPSSRIVESMTEGTVIVGVDNVVK